MSFSAGEVSAVLRGDFRRAGFDQFSAAMTKAGADMTAAEKRMKTSAERTSASLHTLGRVAKVGAGAGILGLGAAIGMSVKKAADFEQQLSRLSATSNATGTQMKALRKSAMDAGAATKFSALDAAKAQTELAKGGLSVSKILGGGLKAALNLAAAGEMDLALAAETTVNAMKQFGLEGSKAGHIADALATAANTTTVDVTDLALALRQGGGVANMAGASFDETVAAISALADASVRGADAGTSLKSFFLNIATPSKQAREAMSGLGLSIFDAQGELKSMPAIADNLRKSFGDLTKEQFINKAGVIAGSDAARALFAIYKAGPEGIRGYLEAQKEVGTAAATAAEKQDNLKGKIENLQGSIETAAIAVGTHFLPVLERLAVKGTEFINELAASGQLDKFAAGLVSIGSTAGSVFGNLASTGADVARVLVDIGQALDLADPAKLTAIVAAFAGFKIAGVVAPMVATLASALGTLALNARTAPSIAAFFSSLPLPGPLKAVTLAVAALAAGIAYLASRESEEERAAHASAAAKREQLAAFQALRTAETDSVNAKQAAQRATLDVESAEKRLNEVRKTSKAGSLEVRRAEQDLAEAKTRSALAHSYYEKQLRSNTSAQNELRDAANKRLAVALQERDAAAKALDGQKRLGIAGEALTESHARLERAERKLATASREFGEANRTASVSALSRQRIEAGADAIHKRNAASIQFLVAQMQGIPKAVRTKLIADNQDALAKAGDLAAKLLTLDKKRTVAKILATSDNADEVVARLKRLLASIQDETVNVNVTTTRRERFGGGGKPGEFPRTGGGPARPGAEGRKVTGPEIALIGEGGGPEYIIPTESKYRGRAIGLLMDAAADLGIAGYKHGKKHGKGKTGAKKTGATHTLFVPERIAFGGVPFDDVEASYKSKREDYQSARKEQRSAQEKVDKAQHRLDRVPGGKKHDGQRGNARDALKTARKERDTARRRANRLEPIFGRAERYWREAKETDDKSKEFETAINLARDDMADASRAGDARAHGAAKGRRQAKIKGLIGVLQRALRLANPKSAHARALREQLSRLGGSAAVKGQAAGFGGEFAEAAAEEVPEAPVVETEADRIFDTGLTDAERKRKQDLEAGIALAALTAPLEDDKAAAGAMVGFLEGVLAAAQADPGRGGSATIAEYAGLVKSARDNLESLTKPGGATQNENADLQAQISQAQENARIANRRADLSEAALSVFRGSGDIGFGAPTINVYSSSLIPGGPAEKAAIASGVTSALGSQPYRPTGAERVGG